MPITLEISNLSRLRRAGECALINLTERVDAIDRHFAILNCQGCQDKTFCGKLARLVECELNLGV